MVDSGLKEAIEGLDKLKFAVVLMIVLAVFLVVGFIVAIFVTVSARSPIPLAVAFLLLASFAYPLWLTAGAYGVFHRAFSLILPMGPVAFYGRGWLNCDFVCGCFGVGGD